MVWWINKHKRSILFIFFDSYYCPSWQIRGNVMDFSGFFFFAPGIFWVMSEDKGFLWGLEFCLHSIIPVIYKQEYPPLSTEMTAITQCVGPFSVWSVWSQKNNTNYAWLHCLHKFVWLSFRGGKLMLAMPTNQILWYLMGLIAFESGRQGSFITFARGFRCIYSVNLRKIKLMYVCSGSNSKL